MTTSASCTSFTVRCVMSATVRITTTLSRPLSLNFSTSE